MPSKGHNFRFVATGVRNFCRKRGALRAGYTGHITQIATKVAEAAETRPLIAEQLELHHEWKAFAAERLLRAHQARILTSFHTSELDHKTCSEPTGKLEHAWHACLVIK